MPRHRFVVGHVLDALKTLPDESVHCVVTSPPYWGLRDYGLLPVAWPEVEYAPMPGLPPLRVPAWEGQLGLEPTPEMYVGHLVLIFREVRRVLRRDGTLWLNLGDTYAGYWGENYAHKPFGDDRTPDQSTPPNKRTPPWRTLGVKPKDLLGIPWRVGFALEADGWWLRSDVVWYKPGCLPESVRDRPTKAHEYVFLLAKSPRYYYDAFAVREPGSPDSHGGGRARADRKTAALSPEGLGRQSGLYEARPAGELGRNRRSVWHINTEPFSGAHFATFPRKLAELCILAGTSERGCCPKCGAPWERDVRRVRTLDGEPADLGGWPADGGRRLGPQGAGHWRFATAAETTGWRPTCRCPGNDGSARCVVLDPFGGAGTTALAADALGRDSVYIDLKREYAEMALRRLGAGERLFVEWELVDLSSEAGGAAPAGWRGASPDPKLERLFCFRPAKV